MALHVQKRENLESLKQYFAGNLGKARAASPTSAALFCYDPDREVLLATDLYFVMFSYSARFVQ